MKTRYIAQHVYEDQYILADSLWGCPVMVNTTFDKELAEHICLFLNRRSETEVHAKTESQSSEEKT